jgi:membrane protein implicated in regulation of membrane protease activity
MSKSIYRRLAASAALLVLVGLGPWWLSLILFLVATVLFPYFYEAALPAFFFDLVYGTHAVIPFDFQFSTTVFCIMVVALINELRPYVMMYR